MATYQHQILTLNIESLLNCDHYYVIPVYQRNYAWQEGEISQLIQDIIDYVPHNDQKQDYYIGTLVTYERKKESQVVFETVDGQQRLTTLTLLTSVIKHFYPEVQLKWFNKINLEFASRQTASETLQHIYFYGDNFSEDHNWNEAIVNGFELCKELLRKKLAESQMSIQAFALYLFHHVKILRVTVPDDTDLNHYFEIMNSRGEQLEKHEILKAYFLETLNALAEPERNVSLSVFNQIWEACANMEKYVQFGFALNQRHMVFGQNEWNSFQPQDFFELTQMLKSTYNDSEKERQITLSDIICGKSINLSQKIEDDIPERFNSVVNFSNFLLHVLRIYTCKDIPLDDKRLIPTFEIEMKESKDKIRFTQDFGYELLRCKFLFDKYVIKREFIGGIDRWSLKRLKVKDNRPYYVNTFGNWDDDNDEKNRSILMLLSMFHVSTPTPAYKHWLNAALLYVMNKGDFTESADYKAYLVSVARSFVFDRFLCKDSPKEYFDMIYGTKGRIKRTSDQIDKNKLRYGRVENNLVFNYLDYLLWEIYKQKDKIRRFEFSFRSSVEHYYPRRPLPGYKPLTKEVLDSFGNLCLISHSKNSKLSNQPPIAKRSHYHKQLLDSIKQWIMMEQYDADTWNEKSIVDHEQKMLDYLTSEMDSEFDEFTKKNQSTINGNNKALRWFNQYKNESQSKALLARAMLCFGDYAAEAGSTYYNEASHSKFRFYDWDTVKSENAFKEFQHYVEVNNPSGLTSIITENLSQNKSLKKDPFRYVFVKHPEILDYCHDGVISWINDGKIILLHQGEKNTEGSTVDLNIHLIAHWFKNAYVNDIYICREYFCAEIDFNTEKESFEFVELGKGVAEIIIDCEEHGKLRCLSKPKRNASNNICVKSFKAFGWQAAYENFYQRGESSTLIPLTYDFEDNLNRASEKIEFIIKNGLGIRRKCEE